LYTYGDIKFVTPVTCRPLLTFWVQTKVDSVNLFNGVHCRECVAIYYMYMTSVSY